MLRICALNESDSELESDGEQNQNRTETREVQEEHLLSKNEKHITSKSKGMFL